MKYAVIGGAGFVGSYIVRLLLSSGHDVLVVDNLHTGQMKNLENVMHDIDFHNVDVRDQNKLENILKNDVDGIFHQAALTDVQESFAIPDKYYDVNVRGTLNIFEVAQRHGIKVVYASSSSVYGDSKKIPIAETQPCDPINPYAMTKLQDEILSVKYHNDGLDVIGLRYFNVFGQGQTWPYAGVINQFLKQISAREDLRIFGDGKQIRDFVHVSDVAAANIAAMSGPLESGFFNIGTGVPTSIKELADIIMELSSQRLGVVYEEELEGDVKTSLADITTSRKVLGWSPVIDLRDGLNQLLSDQEKKE